MVANVDELWRALSRTDKMPIEAIEASLANWDEVSDRFLSKLRVQASGGKLSEVDRGALFVAIHLFAEKRDVRAFVPLCTEIAKDYDGESWLGDAMSETLVSLLISLFDGDTGPLRAVAEAPNADALARSAAFTALGYLTRTCGDVTDEATRSFLREFGQALTDAEDPLVGGGWAWVVAALGYDDLGSEVARAISRDAVDANLYDIKCFHEDLQLARRDPDGLAAFRHDGVKPLEFAVESLHAFEWGDGEGGEGFDLDDEFGDPEFKLDRPDPSNPLVNPLRDVGRNDPCPCGSGKKYKKCCLAA